MDADLILIVVVGLIPVFYGAAKKQLGFGILGFFVTLVYSLIASLLARVIPFGGFLVLFDLIIPGLFVYLITKRSNDDYKKCSHCAEQILKEATVCKHCGQKC